MPSRRRIASINAEIASLCTIVHIIVEWVLKNDEIDAIVEFCELNTTLSLGNWIFVVKMFYGQPRTSVPTITFSKDAYWGVFEQQSPLPNKKDGSLYCRLWDVLFTQQKYAMVDAITTLLNYLQLIE